MNKMLCKMTERQGDFGSLPFLTTTQPYEEVCIMADRSIPRKRNICKVENCGRFCFGHGYCSKHYARLRRGKDPLDRTRKEPNAVEISGNTASIILRNWQGKEIARALVDVDDLPRLGEAIWSLNSRSGYAFSHSHGPTVMMHKFIAGTPEGMVTDHINSVRLDNRKTNLRHATCSENAQHTSPWVKKNKHSAYKGVCRLRNPRYELRKPWMAYIGLHGKRTYLGYFSSDGDAARAYDNAAKAMFGEFAKLNFPPQEVIR